MTARNRLLLDVALFAAIVAAYAPAVTGLSVHEWLSLALVVPALAHLVLNWEWVVRVARGALARLAAKSWFDALVDTVLFVSTIAVILSGLLISQVIAGAFGIATNASAVWHTVHSVSADLTIVSLLAHFALHAKWMARVFQGWLDRIDANATDRHVAPQALRESR